MKTVPSSVNPPQVSLATSSQTVEAANGSTRLVMRAKMPRTAPQSPPAEIQEPADLRGKLLDQEA
jgi:hypothetical protein